MRPPYVVLSIITSFVVIKVDTFTVMKYVRVITNKFNCIFLNIRMGVLGFF